VGTPERLFDWRYHFSFDGTRFCDVSPDGQQFLMFTPGASADAGAGRPGINIVLNWAEELKRLAPVP